MTGNAATLHDVTKSIVDSIPRALLLMALATALALFLQFGSILVPIRAVVLNLLSLSALFGALVWGFQDGHLASVASPGM